MPIVFFFAGSRVVAQDAVIDLSSLDFSQEGIHALDGQWQFYWNQLLTPSDLAGKNGGGEWMGVSGGWDIPPLLKKHFKKR